MSHNELIHAIRQLRQEVREMALDLAKLTASVDRSTKATEALIAAHATPLDLSAVQAAIDGQADALDVESAKAEAAVTPAPAA